MMAAAEKGFYRVYGRLVYCCRVAIHDYTYIIYLLCVYIHRYEASREDGEGLKLYIISLYAILIIKLNHLRGERPVIKTVRGPFVPVYLQITRYLGVHVFAINQPPGFCKGR